MLVDSINHARRLRQVAVPVAVAVAVAAAAVVVVAVVVAVAVAVLWPGPRAAPSLTRASPPHGLAFSQLS